MSKLLIQDDVIQGMDVYVEYTFDGDEVILYDYGIELTNRTRTRIDPPYYETSIQHVSLRGYNESIWMVEKLEEYITAEHTLEADYE
jgi:hypothetical protein